MNPDYYRSENNCMIATTEAPRTANRNGNRKRDIEGRAIGRNTTCRCVCLCVIIALSIVSSLASLGMSFTVFFNSWTMEEEEMCWVKADFNRIFGFPTSTLTKKTKDNMFMYCVTTPAQMNTLFQQIILNKSREGGHALLNQNISRIYKEDSVSAHIMITGAGVIQEDKVNKGEVTLLKDSTLSYNKGVQLGPTRLIILTSGTYYLYSKVCFNVTQPNNDDSMLIYHKVKLFNDRQHDSIDTLLLNNQHHISLEENKRYVRGSYMSGTFTFDEGDQIYVGVADLNHISKERESNFVGLFLLG